MNAINPNQNLDTDALVTQLQREAYLGDLESLQSSAAKIHHHAGRIADKRKEKLENIKQRIQGAHANPCLKFFATVFKVFDLLLKPLSAITGPALNLELGKALEMLERAQINGRLLGTVIDGEKIQGALSELKNLLQQDMQRMGDQQDLTEKQQQQLFKVFEALEQGFEATVNL